MKANVNNTPIEIAYEDLPSPCNSFIDCRAVEEYEIAHYDGAINVPLQHVTICIDSFPYKKEDTFFVYCKSGNRSCTFVTYMRSIGFTNCQSITGGYQEWGQQC
ncbi:MAG: rhodanese-like domain-containing protein [Phycisphaerae bacterium]|nr:rhodanese-like domain-containing protein [Phycisphaerae bacterium]MBT6165042.1 rhodanese-like domain-containing protein [Phycisphaerae bacterium]MBT7657229.1 rhodanese-like domain-containing protein [Phycisphaerae bacterium]